MIPTPLSRRSFLAALPFAQVQTPNPRDIRIESVTTSEESFLYRTPIKFGGTEVDRVTLLNVEVTVRDRTGKTAKGFGSMPLGNVWSFPSKTLKYEQTLLAMQTLAKRIAAITRDCKDYGHPVELNHHLEPAWLKAAGPVDQELKLGQPIPKLCILTTASPFDAALHDAYGKLHGRSVYHCYGPEYLRESLDRYLGKDFRGLRLDQFVLREPKRACPSTIWWAPSIRSRNPISLAASEMVCPRRCRSGSPTTA